MLTATALKDLVSVNRYVNDTIKPMTDLEHWGTIEKWSYPDDGYGDCEDYALLKRRLLIRAGWPREALLLTVVRDRRDEGHAVLTVKTDRGEFILDNQVEGVLPWHETGYRFIKRQSQRDPNVWVNLGNSRAGAGHRRPPAAPLIDKDFGYATGHVPTPPRPPTGTRAGGPPPGPPAFFMLSKETRRTADMSTHRNRNGRSAVVKARGQKPRTTALISRRTR